ncbi:hypothetical protein Bca52824_001666 [Brassica carinata]|uniref:Uncharacterized protein n=1 Tax=Brassica carinata TaxID=52824 RepID=A0A8X7WIZ0_BRACI|nr:hypothetical protein Bca52824_001666 [Brassica carinata]
MAAGGSKRLKNRTTYGATYGIASAPEFVLESQSHGRSPQMTHQSMPPPPPPLLLYEVKNEFNAKAKLRLKNIVGDWKEKWRVLGEDAKLIYISDHVWTDLKAYWTLPRSV